MKDTLFENVISNMIDNGAIQKEDEELYVFGLKAVVALSINIVTMLIIGGLMGMLFNSIVLLLVIAPIRNYAGGIHANGYVKCYLYSIIILVITFYVNKYYLYSNIKITIVGIVIAWLIIYLIGPVTSDNKPVTKEEYIKYKKISRFLVTIYCIIGIILWTLSNTYSVDIFSGMMLCAIGVILGKFQKLYSV